MQPMTETERVSSRESETYRDGFSEFMALERKKRERETLQPLADLGTLQNTSSRYRRRARRRGMHKMASHHRAQLVVMDPTRDDTSLPTRIEDTRETGPTRDEDSLPTRFDTTNPTISIGTADPDPQHGLYKMPLLDRPRVVIMDPTRDGRSLPNQMDDTRETDAMEQSVRELGKSRTVCGTRRTPTIPIDTPDDTRAPDPRHGLYKMPFTDRPQVVITDPTRDGCSLPTQMDDKRETDVMEWSARELGNSLTVCGTGTLNPTLPVATQACMANQWRDVMSRKTGGCLSDQEQRELSNYLYVNGHQYRIVGVIGKGGSCQVYHAIHPQNFACCPVAIKCVDLRDIRDKAIRDTFFKEVAVIEELNKQGCQHIIKLLEWEYHKCDMMLYMVMEKGDMDLYTLLKEEGKPPMWKIKTFWYAMLWAVQEIHRFKIIHSDLKPANFIVMNGCALKLIDFGIADKIENEKTSIERDLEKGTPNYMAPEAIRASYNGKAQIKVGPASDVWSLGCILYSMLYGNPPFGHVKQMKLMAIADPTFVISFPPLPDCHAVDVLRRCLQRNPKQRPKPEELLDHPFLKESTDPLPTQQPTTRAEPLSARKAFHPSCDFVNSGHVHTKSTVKDRIPLCPTQPRVPNWHNQLADQAARVPLKPLGASVKKTEHEPEDKENMGIEAVLMKQLELTYKSALPNLTKPTERSTWNFS